MKVADPRAAGRDIFICDFCGQSSLGARGPESPALVLADNGESCICGTCAAKAAGISAEEMAKPDADVSQPREVGHASERHRLQVMLCSRGTVVHVTRVDSDGNIRAVIWQRPSCLSEAPFSFVYEDDKREAEAALQSITEPSPPRAISITDLDDRVVIKVGFAELRMTPEEAARLFAIGRDFGGKPQA